MAPINLGIARRELGSGAFSVLLFAVLTFYYGGLYLLWAVDPSAYAAWMGGLGVPVWSSPFLDIIAVLSWGDCHHAGINVFQANPCDPLHRLFGYSPVLLDLPIHWLGV